MDILERYLGYEAWTLRYMIVRSRELTRAQLHQEFDIGNGTLHATLSHIIRNIEVWRDLMRNGLQSGGVHEYPPLHDNADNYLQRYEEAMADFSQLARELATAGRLDETYMDILDKPPTAKSYGGTILHLLTHTTVHRWEVQHILQRLGITDIIEGDALSWEAQNNAAMTSST